MYDALKEKYDNLKVKKMENASELFERQKLAVEDHFEACNVRIWPLFFQN